MAAAKLHVFGARWTLILNVFESWLSLAPNESKKEAATEAGPYATTGGLSPQVCRSINAACIQVRARARRSCLSSPLSAREAQRVASSAYCQNSFVLDMTHPHRVPDISRSKACHFRPCPSLQKTVVTKPASGDRDSCAMNKIKTSHCDFQIRPLGSEAGQYRLAGIIP
jgi:hypothetical protein